MSSYMRELPEGPVLEIRMQEPHEMDCCNCGRSIMPPAAVWERIVFEDGTAGQHPWCRKCYRKYVGPIPIEEAPRA
jgi:hypothetical protein